MATNKTVASTETSEDFGNRIGECITHGFLTMGLSIGSKLGLFDLMAGLEQPQTSQQIADAAGFKERYVREWLNFMVVGEIVDKDENEAYFLPEHRRHALAGHHQGNRVIFGWSVPIVSHVEENLMEVFQLDGPRAVTGDYPGIHEWRKRMLLNALDSRTTQLLKAPGIIQELEAGIEVAELGCSTGQNGLELARRYPKSKFYGLDIAEDAIEAAQKTASEEGLSNIEFKVQDVCNLPAEWSGKFGWVYSKSVVHDVPFASKCLTEVHRTLKPGGKFSMIEPNVHSDANLNIGNQWAMLISMMSLYSCLASSLCAEGGEGRAASWGKENVLQAAKAAGFSNVEKIDENEKYFHCFCTK